MTDVAPRTQPDFVGQGEMPPEFDRFNWGACLVAPFWAASFGLRRVAWAYVALFASSLVLSNAFLLLARTAVFLKANDIITGVLAWGWFFSAIVFGFVANRRLWRKQHARFELEPEPKRPFPISRLRKSNRFWGWAAVILIVIGWARFILLSVTMGFVWVGFVTDWVLVLYTAIYIYDRFRRRHTGTAS